METLIMIDWLWWWWWHTRDMFHSGIWFPSTAPQPQYLSKMPTIVTTKSNLIDAEFCGGSRSGSISAVGMRRCSGCSGGPSQRCVPAIPRLTSLPPCHWLPLASPCQWRVRQEDILFTPSPPMTDFFPSKVTDWLVVFFCFFFGWCPPQGGK